MKKISLDSVNIEKIASEIRAGKTIVYPTETCYGLGCDATNAIAVQKVFDIKKRQTEKSVLVVVPNKEMIQRYIPWNEILEKISNLYWPGPLTVVTDVLPNIALPLGVLATDHTIAFRISSHPFVQEITTALNVPLVSTSANITAHKSPYSITEVEEMFEIQTVQPDIVIDGGELPEAMPSTIVRIENAEMQILRQGAIVISEDIYHE